MMLKILIVDHYTALTAGLAAFIKQKWNATEIQFAQSELDITPLLRQGFHLVLINPHLKAIAPYEVAKEIKRCTTGRTKVAFLLDTPNIETARMAMEQRMEGIVLKADSPDGFIHAIKTVLAGHTTIPTSLAQMLYRPEREDPALSILTPKELSTLTLVAQGMTIKEIAGVMNISAKTAETHRNNAGRKLGFPSRAQIIAFALKHGLVSPEQLAIAA